MNSDYECLFEPLKVGSMTLKNRIAMPPMDTNFSDLDGQLSRCHFEYLLNRARGGTGLIIVEATSVSWPEGKISERQLRMNDDCVVPNLKALTRSVHGYGTKILAQIHHGGWMAHPEFCGGAQSVAPTDFNGARALTVDEIHKIEQDFIHAAQIAQKADFDGVEVHGAHMYLLNQFLNPVCNTRTDEYGGSHENRFRIIKEIIEGIREACGPDFVIDLRLGAVDYQEGGNTIDDGVIFAKMAEEAGADMLNLTVGCYTLIEPAPTQWDPEGKFIYMAKAVKPEVNIPVAIVGKLRTPACCAEVISSGEADIVMLGRQLICDPGYADKIRLGKEDEIRPCLNCMEGCIDELNFKNGPITCAINPYVGYEDLYCEFDVPAAGIPKKILVVGGGISGMQFAIISKKRGNDVTIVEKGDTLGGQMILAGKTPTKDIVTQSLDWFRGEVARVGVEVRLNTEADKAYIEKENPDAVVLAMGMEFAMPPIEGIENAVSGDKVLTEEVCVEPDKEIAIIGGGVVGCELAHKLLDEGNKVTVLEMLPELCPAHEFAHRALLVSYLDEHGTVATSVKVTKINPDSVEYEDADGEKQCVKADMTLITAGQKKVAPPLYQDLLQEGCNVYTVGDNNAQSSFLLSTRSAMELAYKL